MITWPTRIFNVAHRWSQYVLHSFSLQITPSHWLGKQTSILSWLKGTRAKWKEVFCLRTQCTTQSVNGTHNLAIVSAVAQPLAHVPSQWTGTNAKCMANLIRVVGSTIFYIYFTCCYERHIYFIIVLHFQQQQKYKSVLNPDFKPSICHFVLLPFCIFFSFLLLLQSLSWAENEWNLPQHCSMHYWFFFIFMDPTFSGY